MWWYRLMMVDRVPYRTAHLPRTVLQPAKVQPRVGSLLDSQPTVSSFSLTGA